MLFFASLLLDFLLGVFYWLGLEQASIPAHYENAHSIIFSFPYSHGLLAGLLWSVLVVLLARYLWQKEDRTRIGIIFGLAVLSHLILDFIVHMPELPVFGSNSYKLGHDSVFRIDGRGDDIIRATESHGPVSFVARDTKKRFKKKWRYQNSAGHSKLQCN